MEDQVWSGAVVCLEEHARSESGGPWLENQVGVKDHGWTLFGKHLEHCDWRSMYRVWLEYYSMLIWIYLYY